MGVVLHEHLAEQPAEKLSVVEGEHPLQVIGADHCEVGGANLSRLLEHRFVDSPRAVRNFYRREKQRCELGLTFAPRSRGIDRDHVLHRTQRKWVDRIPVPRICLQADREPALRFRMLLFSARLRDHADADRHGNSQGLTDLLEAAGRRPVSCGLSVTPSCLFATLAQGAGGGKEPPRPLLGAGHAWETDHSLPDRCWYVWRWWRAMVANDPAMLFHHHNISATLTRACAPRRCYDGFQ